MSRIEQFRSKLAEMGLEGFVLYNHESSNKSSSWYLSGFSGSFSVLVISPVGEYIITDSRYYTQASIETDFKLIPYKSGDELKDLISNILKSDGAGKVGFEEDTISYGLYKRIFENLGVELVPADIILKEMRMVKTPQEIEKIKKAVIVAEEALIETLNYIRPGKSEEDIAAILEHEIRTRGGYLAFDTIVGSGPRSAVVHGKPSDKKLREGEFVLIDYGARVDGYNSDITRTFSLGSPSEEMIKVYEVVYEAQKAAKEAAHAGIIGSDLHEVAASIIRQAGYGEYFGHGLGHSLGMDTHDGSGGASPSNKNPIPAGAVITIEPGIYLPEKFGVRIEDDLYFGEDKTEVLTNLDRELKIL
ncbi:MAG TPA: Xaa-Pro peptidase family protein [Mesotoga infera]|jgi:Xaa-Pro aminopeptidase|uniref:Peptidase M24 n=1 Tax=Mesotoga infera TaxID=1236046 RepID=A0A7Z7LDF3_9BACT|nr:Xaa-Pro peptidase family protein [Mesotoga infera]MBP8660050.1 aminopeptidase P family protein [Mesotoga sp.]NLI06211.1 aminopeptidase P family protein [Thermotogaceae bacterium]SSC11620.1 Peptidase M24 [Mesotoga infera]HNR80315.1 Xaa-Pro peptidase family protein [Mesotoga infera]HOI33944.1 Xaa-Pro peptidase family protein [Mesotoga infera]